MVLVKMLLQSNHGDILTIIFSITSGILTLIGLLSIFVSLNSQQKLEKAREIIWNLTSISYTRQRLKNGQVSNEICSNIAMYENITESKNDITKMVIRISKISIYFVIVLWIMTTILSYSQFSIFGFYFTVISVLFASLAILLFSIALGKIHNIKKIANLPDISDLLDTNKSTNLNTLRLAGMTIELYVLKYNKTDYSLQVGTPIKFENFAVNAGILITYNNQKDYPEIFKTENTINDYVNQNETIRYQNGYWHELASFQITRSCRYIDIYIDVFNEKDSITIFFKKIPYSNFFCLGKLEYNYLFPDACSEAYFS